MRFDVHLQLKLRFRHLTLSTFWPREYKHQITDMSVSILDGQLTRTWKFELEKRQQVITLYHDTITGVRSVMLNYEEVSGSMGNSSLVMESAGHVIPFRLNAEWNGYVAINRSGFFGFEYSCVVNGQSLKEITSELKNVEKDVFKANVLETINAPDEEHNGAMVLWYVNMLYVQMFRGLYLCYIVVIFHIS